MIVTPGDDKSLDKVLKLIKMAPEELVLDLDWSTPDGARRTRPEPVTAKAAKPRAEAAAIATPDSAAEPAPRRTRSRRSSKPASPDTPVETVVVADPGVIVMPVSVPDEPRSSGEPRLRQADRRPGGRTERDAPPAREGSGFGSDIPAFLRRPVALKA